MNFGVHMTRWPTKISVGRHQSNSIGSRNLIEILAVSHDTDDPWSSLTVVKRGLNFNRQGMKLPVIDDCFPNPSPFNESFLDYFSADRFPLFFSFFCRIFFFSCRTILIQKTKYRFVRRLDFPFDDHFDLIMSGCCWGEFFRCFFLLRNIFNTK